MNRDDRLFWRKELRRLNHTVRVAIILRDRLGAAYRVRLDLPDWLRPYPRPGGPTLLPSHMNPLNNAVETDTVIAVARIADDAECAGPELLVEVRGPAQVEYCKRRDFENEALRYAETGDYWAIDLLTKEMTLCRGFPTTKTSLREGAAPIAPLMAPDIHFGIAELLSELTTGA